MVEKKQEQGLILAWVVCLTSFHSLTLFPLDLLTMAKPQKKNNLHLCTFIYCIIAPLYQNWTTAMSNHQPTIYYFNVIMSICRGNNTISGQSMRVFQIQILRILLCSYLLSKSRPNQDQSQCAMHCNRCQRTVRKSKSRFLKGRRQN